MCFSTQKKPFFREREQDPKKYLKKKNKILKNKILKKIIKKKIIKKKKIFLEII